MKKILNIPALLAMCLMIFAGCSHEELSTDQYGNDGVSLNVYGPQPVMRGGQLRFLGSNLDKIVEVIIPGVSPVTDIEVVKAGVPSEIRITVPKDGPEPGLLTLKTADGQEIVTRTELTYSEPVVLESFSPASVKPGDVLTLSGDYFNLMHEVVFAEDVLVSEKDFLKHTRYEIQVKVPVEARTGKVGIGDIDELDNEDENAFANLIYFDEELVVAAPEVTGMTAPRWKAGETVTVTGKNFNYVESVRLPGAVVTEFTVASGNNSLAFVLPAEAQDGEAFLVAVSGVEVSAGEYETVVPAGLSASPETVKAGAAMTISGTDLDLVSSVSLPNSGDAEFEYADGRITLTIPETAQEGDIVLAMVNGKEVSVGYGLVKPVVTGYSANPAPAGSDLVISGTDLDLVVSVTFGGGIEVAVEASESEINVAVPTTAESGAITLNLANGTSVEGEELAVEKPVSCYITELPGSDVEIRGGSILTVTVANEDMLEKVLVNGEEVQFIRIKTALHISLPDLAGAGTVITLISSNGQVEYTIDCIPNTIIEKTLWSGSVDMGAWAVNYEVKPNDIFVGADMKVGQKIRFYITAYAAYWQIQFFDGHWAGLAIEEGVDPEDENGTWTNNINPDKPAGASLASDGFVEITVTEDIITRLTTLIDWGYAMVLQGENIILTKITYYEDNSETVVMDEVRNLGSWAGEGDGGAFRIYKADLTAAKFAPGKTIKFYVEQFAYAQLQVNDANWGGLITPQYNDGEAPAVIEIAVDQSFYDKVMNTSDGWSDTGIVVQGEGLIVHKVTIK